MARKLTIRRGLKAELPTLDIGELGYAIDTEELFIGSELGNVLFAKKSELQTLQNQIDSIKNSDVYKRLGISANGLLTIDGIEQQLGGGNGDMTLVVKDYFEGSTNITKTYTDNMVGFAISNDAGVAGGTLTFTINGITIPVKATETYEANFTPYKSVIINSTVPYRVTVSAPYGVTFDTIAPLNITGLTTSNITTSDLTLSWVASTSSDVSGYDIYQGSTLLATVTETTYNVTGLTPLTSYSFTIKAKDNSGNVANGVSVTVSTLADTTAPNNVTNLVASSVLATSLTLSWTASISPDTTGYEIYKGSTLLTTVTGTTYNVSGLTSNTNYTFTVKAKDGFNNIATGTSVQATTTGADITAPFDVTGLTAGTSTVNSIPVGWTLSSSNDVANYEVAYSSNSGATYTVASSLINSSSTSYTITGLVAGTSYTIRVVAIDTSGNRSTGATVVKATASSTTYTLSASPSSGTYNTTQNVTLSASPAGATIYYTTNGSTPTTSSSVYSTPIAVSANTTIKFFAQDASGNTTSVQTATYTIDTVAPTVTISPVAGTYGTTQSVAISANETATIYYTVDGSTPTTSSTVYSAPISVTTTKTIKYLVVDTAGNQTTGSAIYTIDTVAPDPVTALTAGTVTSSSVPLTWTSPAATDVSKYEVAYSSDSGATYNIAISNLTAPATSYTVTGLTASTAYIIRVVAIDGVGNRSTPTTVSATTSVLTGAPTISSTYNTNTVTTADVVSIPYTANDDADQILTATYTIDGVSRNVTVPVGSNTWNVGTLAQGSHTLTLVVKDSGNLTSTTLTFNITANYPSLSTSVTSGLVNSYNFESLSSGATTVSDSTGTNTMTMSGFTVPANAVSDGGIKGDGAGTVAGGNLLASAGDYTVFVTYKFRQVATGNHNIFSIANNLSWSTRAKNYQVNTGANTQTTLYPAHLHHDVACIKVDSVNNLAYFYLNGTLINSYSYTIGSNLPKLTLFGGQYTTGTNDRGYSTFKNSLFYNRALTDTEISTVSNDIKRSDSDQYTVDTTNDVTTINNGLVEVYDFVASASSDTYVSSKIGIHKLVKDTTTVPSKQADGSYLGGLYSALYTRYRSQRSATYVFKGKRMTTANDDFYSIASTGDGVTSIVFGHDSTDKVFLKFDATKYCTFSVTDTNMHSFVYTVDDDGTNSTIKFFLDGVLKQTATVANSALPSTYPNNFVGNTFIADSTNADPRYKILNYRRALTQAEITKLHTDLMATT